MSGDARANASGRGNVCDGVWVMKEGCVKVMVMVVCVEEGGGRDEC